MGLRLVLRDDLAGVHVNCGSLAACLRDIAHGWALAWCVEYYSIGNPRGDAAFGAARLRHPTRTHNTDGIVVDGM